MEAFYSFNLSNQAIDDIFVIPFSCIEQLPTTTVTTPVVTYPPLLLDCNFESGLCEWSHGSKNFTWQINTGATVSDNTGPLFDHTFQSIKGHYIYIDVISFFALVIKAVKFNLYFFCY
jgi:hypothetical protein